MALDIATLAAAKKYTADTADGLGAVKGSPATVKAITEVDGGHKVTFSWTGISGNEQTMDVVIKDGVNGKNGANGKDGINGTNGANGSDGKTPVKGTDYWTESDIAEIRQSCKDYIDKEILGGAS